jgi:hypothetical protein
MMPNYIYYLDTPELIDLHNAVGLFFLFSFPSILVLRLIDWTNEHKGLKVRVALVIQNASEIGEKFNPKSYNSNTF